MADAFYKTNHDAERIKIGEIIAEIRMDKDMTQKDIALKTGIPQSRIANIEKGKINFTIDTIMDIAAALGVTAGYIFLKALWNGKMIRVDEKTKNKIIRDMVMSITESLK